VKRIASLVAVGFAALLPSTSLAKPEYPGFHTPGRAIYCRYALARPLAITCWRSKDGYAVTLHVYGRPLAYYNPVYRHMYEDTSPILRYGQSWGSYRVIGCKATKQNLYCKNRGGHGFTFSKSGHKSF
jgi:hypothetical protein